MQSRNIVCRPGVYRIARSAAPHASRNASMFAPVASYPRFPSGGEFAPLFRLLDDISSPRHFEGLLSPFSYRHGNAAFQQPYQPRFDVKEVGDGYELRGELPGVDPKDVEVAFTDDQTLVIKGRTERESATGSPQTAEATTSPDQQVVENNDTTNDTEDAASDFSSSSYHKATVEDEDAAMTTAGQPTEAETSGEGSSKAAAETAPVEAEESKKPESRYWVSERSIGEFQRTFTFPSRVNQDGVTASLKNGILNLAIPKAAIPSAKRIEIQ